MLEFNLLTTPRPVLPATLAGMGEVLSKVCLGPCGEDLPLASFGSFKEGKFGRRSKCKACRAEEERVRREATPLTAEQKEAGRQRAKAWGAANLERKAANGLAYSRAHPDRMKQSVYKWRAENPEKAKANYDRWVAANPERVRQYARDWREQNQDLFKEIQKRWRIENPHYWRLRADAFKKVLSDFTYQQWLEVQEEHGHRCAYCLRADVKLTMDHVIAISRGGPHTRDNIVPACQSCNSKKKDRPVFVMAGIQATIGGA